MAAEEEEEARRQAFASAERLHARLVEEARPEVLHSLSVLEGILGRHGRDEVALSFNGGKDCTALLHLLRAAAARVVAVARSEGRKSAWADGSTPLAGVITVYFGDPHEFPEVEAFMAEAAAEHGVEIRRLGGGFKEGLEGLLAAHPIKVVLMGQRRIDPGAAHLEESAPTDAGWPQFLRVNPVLEWGYDDVWRFLREHELPYCSLYDQGYTSLGSTRTTARNPALRRADGTYAPAHELADGALERAGRFKKGEAPPE